MGCCSRFSVALACALIAAGASADGPHGPSGVVLISVDTLRADHVGAYGGVVATPSIDALAAQGVLVERAHTPVPTTGPAHASLLTGLHPWRHRVLDNAVALQESVRTLGEVASENGVTGAAFISSYVLHERFGLARGFESVHFEPTERYRWRGASRERFWERGEDTTDAAMLWLTRRAARLDGRFLLWVHYFDPHTPYDPPPGYGVAPNDPVDLTHKTLPKEARNKRQLRDLIRAYRGEVRYVDAQVGRLLERLHLLGLDERTHVILTSDHGEGLGDHGVLQHGVNLYDELLRVPLIVRGPDLPEGRRIDGHAQLEDLFPTILSLLGVAVPEGVDGVDLVPWLRGDAASSPRQAAMGRRKIFSGEPPLFFHESGSRKWIGGLDGPGVAFELAEDPHELVGTPGAGAPEGLRARLGARSSEAAQETVPELDAEARRALEALGYLEKASEPGSE